MEQVKNLIISHLQRGLGVNNNADIAHVEEHLSCKEDVEGSSPSVGSKEEK